MVLLRPFSKIKGQMATSETQNSYITRAKRKHTMKTILFFSVLFCAIALPVFGQLTDADLNRIRLII